MLTEDKRTQLDGIVQKMVQNRESDDTISFVVNDFKNKYAVQEPEKTFMEKTAGVLDLLFGGGKVGEAIGTGIAKGKFGKTIQKAVIGKELTPQEESFVSPAPSAGEIAGSALQSAALFTPLGTLRKGITTGVRALGMVKGASALGKISAGALSGEVFDIASNLQQGKTGKDALSPGLGTILGGGIPAVGVAKNVLVRFGSDQAPRVINSLVKPLAKDFSYGKNPGRAIAEEGIIANNFDDLISSIRTSRQRIGQEIGDLSNTLSERPLLNIRNALSPLDDAAKVAASQNNPTLLGRLNNVKRAITEVLEPHLDDTGNLAIKSVGSRDLENLTFKQARNILGDVGDLTAFTGNPSDDKLVNSALKQVYGKIKGESLKAAREINPSLASQFEKLTEKYADLHSAEIAAKYRDKIVERQSLVGLNPLTAGIGTGLITAVATGGATIPIAVAGISGALIDKLASTPGFKTRLAYLLSTKTQQEANYLFRKIPALSKFFSLKAGATPGDVLLGNSASKVEAKIAETMKNPKLGLSIEDVSKNTNALSQEARKYKTAEEFVKAQESDYLYHGTNKTTLEAITEQGIVPQRRGVSSLSKTEDYAKNWADNPYSNTKGVMFRVKKDVLEGKIVKRKGSMPETDRQFEILTNQVISPKDIEVRTPDGWRSLATNELSPTKSQLIDIWNKTNKEITSNIPRDTSLTGKDAQLQEASIAKYENNKDQLLQDYLKKNGKVANADEAKKMFIDIGYKGVNSPSFQEASSALNKDAWRYNLNNNPEPYAVLYSGQSGAGKSSAIKGIQEVQKVIKDASAILDGNLSSIKSAKERIAEALKAKKIPSIVHIYRNPMEAFDGTITRMLTNKEEMGRIVPTKVSAANAVGARETLKGLYNQASELGIPKKLIYIVDNATGGKAKVTTLANLETKPFSTNLLEQFNKRAKEWYTKGVEVKGKLLKITKDQYERLTK